MSQQEKPKEFWQFYIGKHRVIVDKEMLPILSKFTWSVRPDKKTFYATTNVKIGGKNHTVTMHRLLTGLVVGEIDHINRNGLDNRLSNLRFCTKQQNQCNRVRKNKFGYRGVFKHGNGYAMQIMLSGKRTTKYGFKTPEDAAREYDKLNKELHGEFGIRNFKD